VRKGDTAGLDVPLFVWEGCRISTLTPISHENQRKMGVSYGWKLAQPFATTLKQSSHPGRLLSLRFYCSCGYQLIVIICQHPHLPELCKKFIA